MTKKVIVSQKEFIAYENLRQSGIVNMLDSEVPLILDITPEQHKYIVNNYETLYFAYITTQKL